MSDEQLKADIKSVTLCVSRAFDEEAEAALRRLRTRLERVPDEDAVTKAVQQEAAGWATYLSDFEARQKALAAGRLAEAAHALLAQQPTPPPAGLAVVPEGASWTYSDNDEEFRSPLCSDELEAISDALDDLQEAEVIYIAKAVQINPTSFVDADTILECIGESAYEECGESVDESWPELAPQERKELERLIADYVFTRSPATFYEIRDVQEFSRAEAEARLAAAPVAPAAATQNPKEK